MVPVITVQPKGGTKVGLQGEQMLLHPKEGFLRGKAAWEAVN